MKYFFQLDEYASLVKFTEHLPWLKKNPSFLQICSTEVSLPLETMFTIDSLCCAFLYHDHLIGWITHMLPSPNCKLHKEKFTAVFKSELPVFSIIRQTLFKLFTEIMKMPFLVWESKALLSFHSKIHKLNLWHDKFVTNKSTFFGWSATTQDKWEQLQKSLNKCILAMDGIPEYVNISLLNICYENTL